MVLAGQDTNRLLNLWHSGDQLPVLSDLIDFFWVQRGIWGNNRSGRRPVSADAQVTLTLIVQLFVSRSSGEGGELPTMKEDQKPQTSRVGLDEITNAIINQAILIHRDLGPGLLESVYDTLLVAAGSDPPPPPRETNATHRFR